MQSSSFQPAPNQFKWSNAKGFRKSTRLGQCAHVHGYSNPSRIPPLSAALLQQTLSFILWTPVLHTMRPFSIYRGALPIATWGQQTYHSWQSWCINPTHSTPWSPSIGHDRQLLQQLQCTDNMLRFQIQQSNLWDISRDAKFTVHFDKEQAPRWLCCWQTMLFLHRVNNTSKHPASPLLAIWGTSHWHEREVMALWHETFSKAPLPMDWQ